MKSYCAKGVRGRLFLHGGRAMEILRCARVVCPCRSGGWWRPVGAGDILAGSGLCRPARRHPLTLACDHDCFSSNSQLKASSCGRCCGGATTVALGLCFLFWFSCKGFVVLCFYSINTCTANFLLVPFEKKTIFSTVVVL